LAPKLGGQSVSDGVDGLESGDGVFVLGATNRRDMLDEAPLRPGRLAEQVEIPLPSEDERVKLFMLYSRRMVLSAAVKLEELAHITDGWSGAEIESPCGEAGRDALLRVVETPEVPQVNEADFAASVADRTQAWRAGKPQTGPIGFSKT
jgi:ATP-dependent 26S proteasome regulatory subunit